jgi:probable HAF family extracellular repeat protein
MASSHSFWIEGLKVGRTVLTVNCECIRDSVTITVREPPPTVPDPRVSRYEAIDLGTLGGAAAVPLAMNDSGDVVGYSLTADGKQHAFLWSNGAMQDLSPGAARSAAQALTNSRVMAGTSEIGGVVHIMQWDNGQMTDLGPVGSTDRQGEVVGITATDVVAWGDSGSAIWQNGLKQFLSGFRAGAVNSRHQVAGTLLDRPFLWDNGSLIALEFAGTPSHAVDINSTGLVLGDTPEWTQYWGVRPTIVVWSQGRISRMLGSTTPVAINDAGDVIGGVGSGAFYSHDGTPWYIPPLGGGWVEPIDLNDSGIVVGESWTVAKKQRAFVWQTTDGPPIDLGIGPFTDDRLGSSAIAINTRGDIVGWVAPCTTPSGRCTELDQSQARAILWRLKRS